MSWLTVVESSVGLRDILGRTDHRSFLQGALPPTHLPFFPGQLLLFLQIPMLVALSVYGPLSPESPRSWFFPITWGTSSERASLTSPEIVLSDTYIAFLSF